MNTASSGSGRVDDIKSHPQGEIRGQTRLVKPEMRHKLAQLPFEEKIRKVGELIRLRPAAAGLRPMFPIVNTSARTGRGRVDNQKDCPEGEL